MHMPPNYSIAMIIAASAVISIAVLAIANDDGPENDADIVDMEDLGYCRNIKTERATFDSYVKKGELFARKALENDDWDGDGHSTLETFQSMMREKCPAELQIPEFILEHIQSKFTYVSDEEQFDSFDWAAYPIETIASGKGDCEDLAILITALLYRSGYDCGFAVFRDHVVAMAVFHQNMTLPPNGYAPLSIECGEKTYTALECCGECPPGFTFDRYSIEDVLAFVTVN